MRRLRGDQIKVFKILKGYENIDSNIFFEIKEGKITRGHNFTLVKKQSRLECVERGRSVVECRTRNQVSPGSNPSLLPFRRLGIFVLSIDAPVHSAV